MLAFHKTLKYQLNILHPFDLHAAKTTAGIFQVAGGKPSFQSSTLREGCWWDGGHVSSPLEASHRGQKLMFSRDPKRAFIHHHWESVN
ncbi:hypothetical protein ILYODFUR_000883 [Ilyodon furcidens]|uniref:Uncharacterized protein n=1 Tax=Ilyodon furcidens TaxID=33524 RepID=A0ABV0VAP3_9TELE